MATDNASSVGGAAIRLTRLTASGALQVGPSASYVAKCFISLSFTPEYETGDEFTTKGADGKICATWKYPDTLKRVNLSIALPDPDIEFTEMISGGSLLATGASNKGYKAPLVGTDATPNGVAIEVWSIANKNGRQATGEGYWHFVFPYAQMRMSGERVIQNDMLATAFEGWAVGNAEFADGPAAPTWPFTSDSPIAYARTTAIPAGTGYQAVLA